MGSALWMNTCVLACVGFIIYAHCYSLLSCRVTSVYLHSPPFCLAPRPFFRGHSLSPSGGSILPLTLSVSHISTIPSTRAVHPIVPSIVHSVVCCCLSLSLVTIYLYFSALHTLLTPINCQPCSTVCMDISSVMIHHPITQMLPRLNQPQRRNMMDGAL